MEAEHGSSKHLGRNNLPAPEFLEKKSPQGFSEHSKEREERLRKRYKRLVAPGWSFCYSCNEAGVLPEDLEEIGFHLGRKEVTTTARQLHSFLKKKLARKVRKLLVKRFTTGECAVCPECNLLMLCIFEVPSNYDHFHNEGDFFYSMGAYMDLAKIRFDQIKMNKNYTSRGEA